MARSLRPKSGPDQIGEKGEPIYISPISSTHVENFVVLISTRHVVGLFPVMQKILRLSEALRTIARPG